MIKNILVTGGSGLLGSALVNHLSKQHNVASTYFNHPENLPEGPQATVKLNLGDRKSLVQLIRDFHFDTIINTVAATNVDRCDTDHDYAQEGNVDPIYSFAEAYKVHKFRLFHISTDYVFDGQDGPPTEAWKPNPINVYGQSKLAAEEELIEANLDFVILRVCALYSADLSAKSNVLKNTVSALRSGKSTKAVTDLFTNPTEVNDLSAAIGDLLTIPELPMVLHLAAPEYLSRYEFGCKIADKLGFDRAFIEGVTIKELNLDAPRPRFAGLRSEIASSLLNRELKSATEIIEKLALL